MSRARNILDTHVNESRSVLSPDVIYILRDRIKHIEDNIRYGLLTSDEYKKDPENRYKEKTKAYEDEIKVLKKFMNDYERRYG